MFFILLAINLPAQNLTGTWEGKLSTDQILQLNILQTGDKICGYTRDYVIADTSSFCKAFFEGKYDAKSKRLFINGRYFLQNTSTHVLMRLILNYKKEKGKEALEQKPVPVISYRERKTIFGVIVEPYMDYDSSEYVYIKKISDQPFEIIDLMKDCIAGDKVKDSIFKPIVTTEPKDSQPEIVKIIAPENPKDSLPVVVAPPVPVKDSIAKPKELEQRKNVEQSKIDVHVKTINLKVYDNAIVDGDTVSILYNGRLLLTHQLLSEKAIEINLELDEGQTRHEIVLFAENLGSIPPNTALIIVTAGEKRYELFASASLEENAVLVFNYRPK